MIVNGAPINGAPINGEGGDPFASLALVIDVGEWALLPLVQAVALPTGQANLPLVEAVTSSGQASLALVQHAFTPASFASATLKWRPVVTLDGVDVSTSLIGRVEIEAEEACARVATLSYLPPAGVFDPVALVGKQVTIDVALLGAAGEALSPVRLFAGLVDVPEVDLGRAEVTLQCTDALQRVMDATPLEVIESLIGGHRSLVMMARLRSNWHEAQERIKTVPASLDLSPARTPVVTPWAVKVSPDYTLTAADIDDGSVSVELAERTALKNSITVQFTYRYPRLWGKGIQLSYWYSQNPYTILLHDYVMPTRAQVQAAVEGTGWEIQREITFTPPPAAHVYLGPDGNDVAWQMDAATRELLCWGWTAMVQKRWAQTVEERVSLTLTAPKSLAGAGELAGSISGALDVTFDTAAWEAPPHEKSHAMRLTFGEPWRTNPNPKPQLPTIWHGGVMVDVTDQDADGRSVADEAMQTLIEQARVEMLAAHRQNRVSCTISIAPWLDRTHTVRINTAGLQATGKVCRLVHTLNMDSGEASTHVTLAISRTGTVGLDIDSPTEPPEVDASAPSAQWDGVPELRDRIGGNTEAPAIDDDQAGFFYNDYGPLHDPDKLYPVEFRVILPGVPEGLRNNHIINHDEARSVDIPEDELVITF